MTLDLTDEETAALANLLKRVISDDRYLLSPRVRTLVGILGKLRPELASKPLPEPRVYEPPSRGRYRRRG